MSEWIWEPDEESLSRSNLGRMMRERGFVAYEELHRWSVEDPEGFWSDALERMRIRFRESPECILRASDPRKPEWLPGARLNIGESCFPDRVEHPAIIHRAPGGKMQFIASEELRKQALRIAGGLGRLGIQPGDAVGIFLPMTAQAVAIYLGIVLAGAVVVSIADSFSAEQVATRLRIGQARALFTAAAVQRGEKVHDLYSRAMDAGAPATVVVEAEPSEAMTLRDGDHTWAEFIEGAEAAEVHVAHPEDAVNILFSSGTTGEPKAIPWDHTTPIKSAADGFFHHDIRSGDVVAWPTNIGWMMGPWLIFATLINRGTIALYEGSPLESGFGEFVRDAGVNMLGVVPSLVGRWRESRTMEGLDWSAIRAFSSTGECSNVDDMAYLSRLAGGKPIIEYCGGTEIGGGYITSSIVQPNMAGAFSGPAIGSRFVILEKRGRPADRGELFLVPPALGLSRRLINMDHDAVYHDHTPLGPHSEKLRRHGDEMQRLPNGYYRALGRADDTMNVGGIKVGAAEIERVIAGVGNITELAAIAVPSEGGGPSRLVVYVGSHEQDLDPDALREEMNRELQTRLNPLFRIDRVIIKESLPRTASNKIMRRVLRSEDPDSRS